MAVVWVACVPRPICVVISLLLLLVFLKGTKISLKLHPGLYEVSLHVTQFIVNFLYFSFYFSVLHPSIYPSINV